jgi:transcriptional regulator with XRE-family HTH domain
MRLRRLIKKLGASNVARACGFHRSLISNLLSRRSVLGYRLARKIAKATNTTLSIDKEWKFIGTPKLGVSNGACVSRDVTKRNKAKAE